MAAQPNVSGMARLSYVAAGVAIASWGLWGADQGWTQWSWLALGGALLVFGVIGYSPVHAWISKREPRAN